MRNDGTQPTTHITDSLGRIRTETTDPTNPKSGDMYFNTLTNCMCYYTGDNWIAVPFND